jgi:hypothetical protein
MRSGWKSVTGGAARTSTSAEGLSDVGRWLQPSNSPKKKKQAHRTIEI